MSPFRRAEGPGHRPATGWAGGGCGRASGTPEQDLLTCFRHQQTFAVSTYPEGILTVSNSTVWPWKQLTAPSPISGSQRQGGSCFPSVSSWSPRAPTREASKGNMKGCHRVKKSQAMPRGAPPPLHTSSGPPVVSIGVLWPTRHPECQLRLSGDPAAGRNPSRSQPAGGTDFRPKRQSPCGQCVSVSLSTTAAAAGSRCCVERGEALSRVHPSTPGVRPHEGCWDTLRAGLRRAALGRRARRDPRQNLGKPNALQGNNAFAETCRVPGGGTQRPAAPASPAPVRRRNAGLR